MLQLGLYTGSGVYMVNCLHLLVIDGYTAQIEVGLLIDYVGDFLINDLTI